LNAPLGLGLIGMNTNSLVEFKYKKDRMELAAFHNCKPLRYTKLRDIEIEIPPIYQYSDAAVHSEIEGANALQICLDHETNEQTEKNKIIIKFREYLIKIQEEHFTNEYNYLGKTSLETETNKLLPIDDEKKFKILSINIDNIKKFINYVIPLPESQILSEDTSDTYYDLLFSKNSLSNNLQLINDINLDLPLSRRLAAELWIPMKNFAISQHCFLVKWAGAQSQNEHRFEWSRYWVGEYDEAIVNIFLSNRITRNSSITQAFNFQELQYALFSDALILISNWGVFIPATKTQLVKLQENGERTWCDGGGMTNTYDWGYIIYLQRVINSNPIIEPLPHIPQIGNAFLNNPYLFINNTPSNDNVLLENAFPIWGLFPAISFILQFFFPKLLVKIDKHFQFILNYIKFQFFIGLNLTQDY
jgi:hypothetical protein